MKQFSQDIQNFIHQYFPEIEGQDLETWPVEKLKSLIEQISYKRQEMKLLELSMKVSANAAYGASGNEHFYWYRPELAAAITGEARRAEMIQVECAPKFMTKDIWERKDLWKMFNFELDENKRNIPYIKDMGRKLIVQVDTDSAYIRWDYLFNCMTDECQKKYATDEQKLNFILDFYKRFLNDEQNRWVGDMTNARHGKSIQEFELELVCKSLIGLAKKKYVKGVVFDTGHFMVDNPKLKSTGVEIVKSTTPALCRKFMKEIVDTLLYNYDEQKKEEFIFSMNARLKEMYAEFKNAPIDDISNSVAIGDYKKYVIDDTNSLSFQNRVPFSVRAAARYNYLANKNGRADLKMMTGKIKYYNIRNGKETDYFGFPAGECPSFAPAIDYTTQWQKNIIDPINRFLTAMKIPEIGPTNMIQVGLFGW